MSRTIQHRSCCPPLQPSLGLCKGKPREGPAVCRGTIGSHRGKQWTSCRCSAHVRPNITAGRGRKHGAPSSGVQKQPDTRKRRGSPPSGSLSTLTPKCSYLYVSFELQMFLAGRLVRGRSRSCQRRNEVGMMILIFSPEGNVTRG